MNPRRSFALLSGGDHSLVATHKAMIEGLADEVVHIDTGIGIREGRDFVIEVCKSFGWPLRFLYPPQKTYEELVLQYGFPGPAMHYLFYRHLKERAIRKLVKESKLHRMDEIVLISGVHQQESARRMGYTAPRIKIGAQIWEAPLFNYNALDFHDYKRKYSLPTSPVKEKLGFSGECLCGAFAKPHEIEKIEKFYRPTAIQIHSLEDAARIAGKHCVWGTRPRNADQYDIPFMPLCSSCPTLEVGRADEH
jgi:3'-phosphoadenosine 5'-phosphosulfate sulfotransferase (PAPS reductase)/FAD synthetase